MEPEFWLERWEKKQIGFHQSDFNPFLKKYGEFYFKNSKSVFLPLCGKTKDLLWFRDKKLIVTGIELSQIACEEFFTENQILYYKENEHNFCFYIAYDFPLVIIQGDFFNLTKDIFSKRSIQIDSLYDRASFVAMPKKLRKLYVKKILELFPKVKVYFLITMEFESTEKKDLGPPFSVPDQEVYELFSNFQSIKLVEKQSLNKPNTIFAVESLFVLENEI